MNRDGKGVLIITPTYNERENLEELIEGVREALPHASILIVDDASPDGTGALADEIAKRDPLVHVLHRAAKLGLGSAYLDGFRFGLDRDYTAFIQMDADGSHDPAYLPAFIERLIEGNDLVIGSRNIPGGGVEGWGAGRHALSKGGSVYSRLLLGLDLHDLTSGYKAMRRSLLEALPLESIRSEGYSFQIELSYRASQIGAKIVEHPIVFVDRRAGQSKMSRAIFFEAIWMVPSLRLRSLRGAL